MKILMIYASYSGSTFLVSEVIQGILSRHHEVVMKKVQEVEIDELNAYDVILLGSTSWDYQGKEGFPHNAMLTFIEERLKDHKYPGKPIAVYGCGDRHFTYFCGAVDHLEAFVKHVEARPLGSALRVDKYFMRLPESKHEVEAWAESLLKELENLPH